MLFQEACNLQQACLLVPGRIELNSKWQATCVQTSRDGDRRGNRTNAIVVDCKNMR